MKRILNKWQFHFRPCGNRYAGVYSVGWHPFELGIFKIHTYPKDGEEFYKKHYHGFILRFMWWFPIDFYRY